MKALRQFTAEFRNLHGYDPEQAQVAAQLALQVEQEEEQRVSEHNLIVFCDSYERAIQCVMGIRERF